MATNLQHFGVKGMKWGVRKDDSGGGSSKGGVVKRAAIKRATKVTAKQKRRHEAALSGHGVWGKMAAPDRLTWGRGGRFERYQETSISRLDNSLKRIENGELLVRTILFGPQYKKS